MLKIALDLDGVCYEWEKTARYMLRRKYSQERLAIPIELFSPSQTWETIQDAVSPEKWDWLWNEGVELGLFRYGHCVRGAIEGVEALGELGSVSIVTARPLQAVKDTQEWVSFMFNRAKVKDIIFKDSKHEVEADVYIDDGPHHILKLHELGKKVIVFRQPWNNLIPFSVGIQVRDWQGVVDKVRDMSWNVVRETPEWIKP